MKEVLKIMKGETAVRSSSLHLKNLGWPSSRIWN